MCLLLVMLAAVWLLWIVPVLFIPPLVVVPIGLSFWIAITMLTTE